VPKSLGQHCINVAKDQVSHILVKARGSKFPDPAQNSYSATVVDTNNSFGFTATAIPQPETNGTPYPTKILAIKLISNLPVGGGGNPTDGLLTITINVTSNTTGTTATPPVGDVPVDYISDPTP
jgi:hypothetical protein